MESFYNISKTIKYLFTFINISENENCKIAMKYFSKFDRNVVRIFHLQWKIGNISDMFLQYSVLCGQLQEYDGQMNDSNFWFF